MLSKVIKKTYVLPCIKDKNTIFVEAMQMVENDRRYGAKTNNSSIY